jgi:amino acid adenylation domain-containing protein
MSNDSTSKLLQELSHDSILKSVLTPGHPGLAKAMDSKTLELTSWQEIFQSESESFSFPHITDNYPAYILFTSGSTGTPKGVVISHLNSLAFVNMASDFFTVTEKDRFCGHAPLQFDLSVFDIFVALSKGATLVLVPEVLSVFPAKLSEYIEETKISVWNSVASVLSLLAERGKLERFAFESLRLVIFSGDVLPVKYLRKLKNSMRRSRFFNIYGQTEANSSTFYEVTEIPDSDSWKIPIGKSFPNFEVFVLDEAGQVVNNPGSEGELHVRASTVAMGYWKDAQKTAASFVQDSQYPFLDAPVYKTGDLVRIDEAGNYVFSGRKDHLVKSAGYRIELGEIELALYGYPGVNQAAVVTLPDDLIGNRIIAYVSLSNDKPFEKAGIINHCAKRLPKYMIPEKIEYRASLPRTSTGKVDRRLLAKNALAELT